MLNETVRSSEGTQTTIDDDEKNAFLPFETNTKIKNDERPTMEKFC